MKILPKANALILGMLLEGPMSPYEMVHLSKTINPTNWFSVAEPTFYANIHKLSKDNLVIGTTAKQENMHLKTYYSITELGKETVINTFINFLSSGELDPEMFRLVVIFLGYLEQSDIYACLSQRVIRLEKRRKSLKSKLFDNDFNPPINILVILEHTLHTLDNEIGMAQELLEINKRDPELHSFSQLKLENMKLYGLQD